MVAATALTLFTACSPASPAPGPDPDQPDGDCFAHRTDTHRTDTHRTDDPPNRHATEPTAHRTDTHRTDPPTDTSTPTCDPSVDSRGFGSVPADLVGTWNGGWGDESGYWWSIYSDGSYTMANDNMGTWEEGWMDVQAGVLTFYPDCGETASTDWTMDSYAGFTILSLQDGAYSFVPA